MALYKRVHYAPSVTVAQVNSAEKQKKIQSFKAGMPQSHQQSKRSQKQYGDGRLSSSFNSRYRQQQQQATSVELN